MVFRNKPLENLHTKSLSLTASRLLFVTPVNPSSKASASLSTEKGLPAKAPLK